jgi:hypothetical protein
MSQLQHTFKDGRIVDALVQMTNFTVGIDSKFPLPSFERIVASTSDDERPKLRRQFARDVASHVDKIASAYIQPTEGTLDFALLRNAYTKYDDGQKRLDRLGLQLTQTQADNAEQTALTEGKP